MASLLAPAPGSCGPRDEEVAATERRKAFRSRCFPKAGNMLRCCYQGASFDAPSPLIFEGRELKAQLARRRGDAEAWLFESAHQKSRKASQHIQRRPRERGDPYAGRRGIVRLVNVTPPRCATP